MKFKTLLEKAVDSTKLQKVRIKVDPLWSEKLGIINSPYYEGYILQECPNGSMDFKVYIINTPSGINPVQTVNKANIEPVEQEITAETPKSNKLNVSRLSTFKRHLVAKFQELNKDIESAEVNQILTSNDMSFIETILKQMGLNDEDILNLYRKTLQK